MNHPSSHLNSIDDTSCCQLSQKTNQPVRVYQHHHQRQPVQIGPSSVSYLGADQRICANQEQPQPQQTSPAVFYHQYQSPPLEEEQYQTQFYVTDTFQESPAFYQPVCPSQLQQQDTVLSSAPSYVSEQPVQYISTQPVNRVHQVHASRCEPVASVIVERRLPHVIRQQQFISCASPSTHYYHNHDQQLLRSQQHQIRQQQQQQQEPLYQPQDAFRVGRGGVFEDPVLHQLNMSQENDFATSHLYEQPQIYYTDPIESRATHIETNNLVMSQQVITVGQEPQPPPLETPVSDIPSSPVDGAYLMSSPYPSGHICTNQAVESQQLPSPPNSHQIPSQVSTARLVSRFGRGSGMQASNNMKNSHDTQSPNDQQQSPSDYNRAARPQPSSPLPAKPQRRQHCRDLVDVRSSSNISQDWLDSICKQLIGDMERFGICVIDNFLGNIKGSLILDEVKQLYSSGQYTKGRLVSNKRASQTLGEDTAAIRNDRVIWIDGCEEGCTEINNLIQTLCSVITNSSRLSLYSNNGLDKAIINKRTKAHVACYPGNGTRYIKHVDNPNGDGRVITSIYYLNKNWDTKRDGGLLRMFPAGMDEVANIEPLFDRALFFWSDRRNPHEVLPAYKNRFAITVWYISESRPA